MPGAKAVAQLPAPVLANQSQERGVGNFASEGPKACLLVK